MTDTDHLTWPSGQHRRPLRSNQEFTPELCRAARGLMGLSELALANRAGHWPRYACVTADDVKAFENGGEIDDCVHAAICEALYHEGFGVIVVGEAGAGAGVRWALNADRRALGTYQDRKYRPVIEAAQRRAALVQAWWDHIQDLREKSSARLSGEFSNSRRQVAGAGFARP